MIIMVPAAYSGGGGPQPPMFEQQYSSVQQSSDDVLDGVFEAYPCDTCGDGWYCNNIYLQWRGGTYCSVYTTVKCANVCVAMPCGQPDYCY
jgi:hypothetical protein